MSCLTSWPSTSGGCVRTIVLAQFSRIEAIRGVLILDPVKVARPVEPPTYPRWGYEDA